MIVLIPGLRVFSYRLDLAGARPNWVKQFGSVGSCVPSPDDPRLCSVLWDGADKEVTCFMGALEPVECPGELLTWEALADAQRRAKPIAPAQTKEKPANEVQEPEEISADDIP